MATVPSVVMSQNGQGPAIGLVGSTLTLGVNPALSGTIRLPNLATITFRDAANAADLTALSVAADGTTLVGNTVHDTRLFAFGTIILSPQGVDRWAISGGVMRPLNDNSEDIGLVATNRVKDIYLAGQLKQTAVSGPGIAGGLLGNAPSAGNPQFWLPITIGGVQYWLPAWHL